MSDKGLLGDLFDFDGDGKLDIFEKAAEFSFIMEILDSDNNEEESDD